MMNEQPKRQGISRMFTRGFAPHVPHCSFICYHGLPELLGSNPDTGSAVPARRVHKP